MPDIVEILSKVRLLSGLTKMELIQLAEDFKWEEYPPGAQIITQGQTRLNYYILVSGQAEMLVRKKVIMWW